MRFGLVIPDSSFMMVLIDNYDSFTYNLVQRLGELDPNIELQVYRNDKITLDRLAALEPDRIIISPGPCTPREAGISNEVLRRFAPTVPILGVCLGHQCIGHVFGGEVVRNSRIMHGKTSPIHHDGQGVFRGLSNPFEATRYHSLVIRRETFHQSRLPYHRMDGRAGNHECPPSILAVAWRAVPSGELPDGGGAEAAEEFSGDARAACDIARYAKPQADFTRLR